MNKERREELYGVIESLDEAIDQLADIQSEEEESYDNLPDGLQCGKTGEAIQNAIDKLSGFSDEISQIKDKIEKMAKNKK